MASPRSRADLIGARVVDVHELRPEEQDVVRSLILNGLGEHWGTVDPALNRDLDDLSTSYVHGSVLVACDGGEVVGTGTVFRRDGGTAEIVQMSVAPTFRCTGLGRPGEFGRDAWFAMKL